MHVRAIAWSNSLRCMKAWVTQREAAELLRVHMSAVPKMVRRGDLSPRDGKPSLSRDRVVELAAARAVATAERERRRTTPPQPPAAAAAG